MDTVVACSTPFGSSAIATVRISGPKTKKVVARLQKTEKNNQVHKQLNIIEIELN